MTNDDILKILEETGPKSAEQIAERLTQDTQDVLDILYWLRDNGEITKTARNVRQIIWSAK